LKVKKLIQLYTKLFGLWVLLGFILAYYRPNLFIPLRGFMDWFFAFTMFGIGLVLNLGELKAILVAPQLILLGVLAQYSIMPMLGFTLAKLFSLSKDFALGLILTGSAPGAMSSNIISYLAGADVAYSVSLTTVSTFLSPILTPALTYFLAKCYLKVPFWPMFLGILKMVVIPLALGIYLKVKLKEKIAPFTIIFPAISVTFIVFICALVAALNKNYLSQMSLFILLIVLFHNLSGYLLGYSVAKGFNLSKKRRRTLSIEIGMQNAGLGTVLALKYFSAKVALPAALFVIISVITSALLARYWGSRI
jgi:BASS family bile acid:Na+ symporter